MNGEIRELLSDTEKNEFKGILHVLQRFYVIQNRGVEKNTSFQFRQNLLNSENEKIQIQIRKYGESEYQIVGVLENGDTDCWIHIDGISEERLEATEKGNLDHPVFKIVCLKDLWEKAKTINELVMK